ncbi:MAG: tRNA (N6-threonylcarbamoyladenosine(37)-N6)-methyltransferase TrmO [Gammaproteobacteria bacterium]|nr:tRNA (N6-threonylcarbamoyladenosine(37)-N6)-methyltransferase TrmO [Gammaproteobacteria bacterium]
MRTDTPLTFALKPIGHVVTEVPDEEIPRRRREVVSEILILPEYVPGLAGLEAYSHLIVIFFMHRAPPCTELVIPADTERGRPAVGTFAMRTRNRPNPLGLAVVDLLEINDNRLKVRRLDAWHDTPVVDLKPYDFYDIHTGIRVPAWSNSARQPRAVTPQASAIDAPDARDGVK